MSGCSAEWRPRAGYFIISYDLETLLAEAGAEVPGPCPIVADALAGLTEPQYSMLLLGPGPSSRSLRDSPSAEFRSSSTPDNSELMNCLAKWAGIRKPADTKMLVAAVAGSGASPAPMILGWNYGEPATLLRQAYAATRKILIGQTAGSIC